MQKSKAPKSHLLHHADIKAYRSTVTKIWKSNRLNSLVLKTVCGGKYIFSLGVPFACQVAYLRHFNSNRWSNQVLNVQS
jgi:hypothetical protein